MLLLHGFPPPANHQGTSAALPFASAAASFLAAATLPAALEGVGWFGTSAVRSFLDVF